MYLVTSAWLVIRDALGHFNDDDGWAMASHVSLSVLTAFFPFAIFVTALACFIGQQELASDLTGILFDVWPREVAEPIAGEIDRVIQDSRIGLLTVAALVALFLASNGVEAVRTALNRAYRVTEGRSFVKLRLQGLLVVFAGAVASLGLASITLSASDVFTRIEGVTTWLAPLGGLNSIGRYVITGAILLLVVGVSHAWLPAARLPVRLLWPGILFTVLFWILGGWIFSVYLERISNLTLTYAGLAGVFAAIFFMYLIATTAIIGGEFNASLARRHITSDK